MIWIILESYSSFCRPNDAENFLEIRMQLFCTYRIKSAVFLFHDAHYKADHVQKLVNFIRQKTAVYNED